MNENLNLVEILKYVSRGIMLWSPIYGDCEFVEVKDDSSPYPIVCLVRLKGNHAMDDYVYFSAKGEYSIEYGNCECALFPSRDNRDWSTFRITKGHKDFKPFQKNIDKVINSNGFDYVDLNLPSGTKWAAMNVGAPKPSDFGLYFQWGSVRGFTKGQVCGDKAFSWSTYKWSIDGSDSNFTKYNTAGDTLDLEDDAAHVNMGGDWHMPSPQQIQELLDNTTRPWTTQNGVNGRLFTSKNGNSIFIPAAGNAWDGSLSDRGDYGYVWSSMLSTDYASSGQYLYFGSGGTFLYYSYRYDGFSVRGVIG